MGLLDWFRKQKPPVDPRRLSAVDSELGRVVAARGTDAGIAWLEGRIHSPIVPEWGRALFHLKPTWHHLERWIRLSKLHCLVAIDALLIFSAGDSPVREGEEPQLPEGADPKLIDDALKVALAEYGNPRLNNAAKRIRHLWPAGPRPRHAVNVPPALADVAKILFRHNPGLLHDWQESMATALEPPASAAAIYDSMLHFADTKQVVAIVDWKESPDEIVARLGDLQSAQEMKGFLGAFTHFDGDSEELLRAINDEIGPQGRELVSLDHGGDDYPLTFLASETLTECEMLIASFRDAEMRLVTFKSLRDR